MVKHLIKEVRKEILAAEKDCPRITRTTYIDIDGNRYNDFHVTVYDDIPGAFFVEDYNNTFCKNLPDAKRAVEELEVRNNKGDVILVWKRKKEN